MIDRVKMKSTFYVIMLLINLPVTALADIDLPLENGVITSGVPVSGTLVMYPWPGNVRELENTVERLLIMRNSDFIGIDELPEKLMESGAFGSAILKLPAEGYSLEQLEREVVVEALERNNWNQTAAARFLRIPRHTLIYRIEKYGITLSGNK